MKTLRPAFPIAPAGASRKSRVKISFSQRVFAAMALSACWFDAVLAADHVHRRARTEEIGYKVTEDMGYT